MKTFTDDHFSNNIKRWERHVKSKSHGLFLGPHQGRAPIWFLENMNNSQVVCIEKFPDKDFKLFKNNVKEFQNRVKWFNMSFRDGLIKISNQQFDFIFIDTIDSREVLECMVLAFPLLKPQGLLIVDDYTNSKEHLPNCPKFAVDSFMNCYAPYVKAIEFSWQAVIMKRSRPLPWPVCNSEYYHEDLSKI